MPQSIDESADFDPIEPKSDVGSYVAPPSAFFKWFKRLLAIALVMVLLAVVGIGTILYLVSCEPEFYRTALEVDSKLLQENGSQMESRILNLRNSVLTELDWSANFSEEQINGWLAWDLDKKFPGLIPPEISDPRVIVGEQNITLAFRCSVKPLKGVVVIKADVFLTGVINQLGIRVESIHCGLMPIPVASIAEQLERQAKRAGLELEWDDEQGDSVAIINLPDSLIKPNDGGTYIELDNLQIQDKRILISGKTHPPDF